MFFHATAAPKSRHVVAISQKRLVLSTNVR
jgi:hypothetical protein